MALETIRSIIKTRDHASDDDVDSSSRSSRLMSVVMSEPSFTQDGLEFRVEEKIRLKAKYLREDLFRVVAFRELFRGHLEVRIHVVVAGVVTGFDNTADSFQFHDKVS